MRKTWRFILWGMSFNENKIYNLNMDNKDFHSGKEVATERQDLQWTVTSRNHMA